MHPKTLAWATAATATACAFGLANVTGLQIEEAHFLILAGIIASLSGLQAFYAFYRREPLVADLFGTLAVNAWAFSMIGILALAGLAVNRPLIDSTLIRADAILGLNARSVVEAAARLPLLHAPLTFAYTFSVALLLLTPLALIVLRRAEAAWRLCAAVALCGLACTLLSIPFPAVGAFAGLGVPDAAIAQLPEGSGLYHLIVFEAYRSGAIKSLDVFNLSGVVTFPSFHTAFACTTARALMPYRKIRPLVLAWTAFVLASTIVIGGHYFVDIIAGMVLFAFVERISYAAQAAVEVSAPTRAATSAA